MVVDEPEARNVRGKGNAARSASNDAMLPTLAWSIKNINPEWVFLAETRDYGSA
jgi:hypothetical protein